jgi:hypothetical protein
MVIAVAATASSMAITAVRHAENATNDQPTGIVMRVKCRCLFPQNHEAVMYAVKNAR